MHVWLSAGEPSGDRWGAALAGALIRARPGVRLTGMAGPLMRAAGVEGISTTGSATAVTGFTEPFRAYRAHRKLLRTCANSLRAERPDAMVVIDYPGFHLRLLREVESLGIPAVYYMPPQVWAWGAERARTVGRLCARVVTGFDFERAHFAEWMPRDSVAWLGHPLADEFPECGGVESGPLAMLPGSRKGEIERIAPVIARAADALAADAVFAVHDDAAAEWVRRAAGDAFPVVPGRTREMLESSSAAVVCAGTATLEASCAGLPAAFCYRTDPLTFAIAKRIAGTRYAGLPNILLGEGAYPELLQRDLTVDGLVATVASLRERTREEWRDLGMSVRAKCGEPGVAGRVAALVIQTAEQQR